MRGDDGKVSIKCDGKNTAQKHILYALYIELRVLLSRQVKINFRKRPPPQAQSYFVLYIYGRSFFAIFEKSLFVARPHDEFPAGHQE